MELKEFITSTLVEIDAGVRDANAKVAGSKFAITPTPKGVEFDVALTVSSGSEGGAGGKLRVAVVEFGVGMQGTTAQERVSRIKFTVEILGVIQ